MCDCIKTIEKNIEKEYGEFNFVNMGQYINPKSVVGNAEIILRPEGLWFKAKGKKTNKVCKFHIAPTHCMFCGTAY